MFGIAQDLFPLEGSSEQGGNPSLIKGFVWRGFCGVMKEGRCKGVCGEVPEKRVGRISTGYSGNDMREDDTQKRKKGDNGRTSRKKEERCEERQE